MNKIDIDILNIDSVISKNIDKFNVADRGLLSQNILSQLRNFVEDIFLKIYSNGQDIKNNFENIRKAEAYVKTRGNIGFLSKFHKLLQISSSHYTLDEDRSERLMLKYYEYLIRIKKYLKSTYDLDTLSNINKFPINNDKTLQEYYEKIAERIKQLELLDGRGSYRDRYYVQKVKPFFVDHEIYYEVTLTLANDKVSKFDRIIAFTRFDISPNYAVDLSIIDDSIQILDNNMTIQIIGNWNVSIRPCEFNNFAAIFNHNSKVQRGLSEYGNLMNFLTKTDANLVEIINLPIGYFNAVKEYVLKGSKKSYIFDVLDQCRELVINKKQGSNVIRYLLHNLNNKIIKQQCAFGGCNKLSNLNLDWKCVPFDEMPFYASLINHNPKISDLFDCIDQDNREHELFAKFIKNSTEIDGNLYNPKKDITTFSNIDNLITKYNSLLYYKHGNRKLEIYKECIYIKEYEDDTYEIIKKLKEMSSGGFKKYSNSVESWLKSAVYSIDCPEKKEILKKMFEHSRVALIYGAAGTGKSTMIKHISNFFNSAKKLYLAKTNPAINNLTEKITISNSTFKTIDGFLSPKTDTTEFDLLIIDECSTVSNSDMRKVLEKASYKILVLVGDVFQIESISFGNWFSMAKSFIPEPSVFELTRPYRTKNDKLLELWSRVRRIDSDILEHITKNKYSVKLDDSIFSHPDVDEIILCLNYDGLYGINNINRFLQNNNPSPSVRWGVQMYKVNDPILFNESNRFFPVIYNNLKGKILGIVKSSDKIQFDIEINKVINEFDAMGHDFQLLDSKEKDKSIIRFYVDQSKNTDEDNEDNSSVVPFQIAYAVSIHKAQGLEYDSVKIVVTNEIEEMITHNIFYTAITRARDKLKIYWTPETESKVLGGLKKKDNGKDVALLKYKYNL